MRCRICGGNMQQRVTDLPFKLGDRSIVIVRDLPVTQCATCEEYVLAHSVMQQVERILSTTGQHAEIEVVRYAA
ncbi:MAG: YgiT-type zinc finger protein [Acidobacteria bacterium]|nr:YgiT-type zinc finger protein [Acidobacteriota bacterium]